MALLTQLHPGPSTPLQPFSKAQAKEDAQELRQARKRCFVVVVVVVDVVDDVVVVVVGRNMYARVSFAEGNRISDSALVP